MEDPPRRGPELPRAERGRHAVLVPEAREDEIDNHLGARDGVEGVVARDVGDADSGALRGRDVDALEGRWVGGGGGGASVGRRWSVGRYAGALVLRGSTQGGGPGRRASSPTPNWRMYLRRAALERRSASMRVMRGT